MFGMRVLLAVLVTLVTGLCLGAVAADSPPVVLSNVLVEHMDCCDCPEVPEVPEALLTATTQPVSAISEVSATLWGLAASNETGGYAVRFQYGASSTYGTSTPWVGGFTGESQFSAAVTGLSPGTVYHFRAQVGSGTAQMSGLDVTFRTLPGGPVVASPTLGVGQVGMAWTKGVGAARTLIRRSLGASPSSPSEGDLVYLGPDEACADVNLVGGTQYFYSVWSEVGGVYSSPAVMFSAVPLVTEPPSSTACGLPGDWQVLVVIGGIAAFAVLYVLFRRSRRPRDEAPPRITSGPPNAPAEGDGRSGEEEAPAEEVPEGEGEETLGETLEESEEEELEEEEPEEEKPKGFSENAPKCPRCHSSITQPQEGTEKTWVCMNCGEEFEYDAKGTDS